MRRQTLRVAIIGNSGSGKSTLARWLAAQTGVPLLDLDTVAWEQGETPVPRSPEAARRVVQEFCGLQEEWVVEGCYTSLVEATLGFGPTLVFLDPGLRQCLSNCRSRPWEPHKYSSREEQDARLEMLLSWVREYYERDDEMSLARHRALCAGYPGPKLDFGTQISLAPPPAELAALLAGKWPGARTRG